GAQLEVVVDRGHLSVEQEPLARGAALEPRHQLVDQVHELEPEHLERRVPLTIPVRVGDDVDRTGHDAGYGCPMWSAAVRDPPRSVRSLDTRLAASTET